MQDHHDRPAQRRGRSTGRMMQASRTTKTFFGKEDKNMAENEKQTIQNIEKAISTLPEDKKQFLLGYMEGVAAMAEKPDD